MNIIKHNEMVSLSPIEISSFNFDDKELSSYVYGVYFACINLEGKELDTDFLKMVYSESNIITLANIYLTFQEKENHEKYEGLKEEDGFDLQKVIKSLSDDLKANFEEAGTILHINRMKILDQYKDTNPIKKYLEKPFYKRFCQTLNLNYIEALFLLLNFLNYNNGWLFPAFLNHEYKTEVFAHISESKTTESDLKRINSKFVELGLFSSPWTLNDYVYNFFVSNSRKYCLSRICAKTNMDIYDYEDIKKLNQDSLKILRKEEEEFYRNKKGCWQAICGNNDFRKKNFLAFLLKKHKKQLYELNTKLLYKDMPLNELKFYLFSYTVQLQDINAVLYLDSNVMRRFFTDSNNTKSNNVIQILNGNINTPSTENSSSPILENVRRPVFISVESLDEEKRTVLKQHGINILFSTELKLPLKDMYFDKAMTYFFDKGIPENLLKPAVDECNRLKLEPSNWDEVIFIAKNSTSLEPEELSCLLKNKYASIKGENLNRRKNAHYSFKALNTSEPIEDLVEALKNADEYQNGEYDSESGIRILAYGESGTGKTACVEEISKMLNKPLEIIRVSDILRSYVGETEKNIKDAFEKAARNHAVLLIDEADSFIHARGDSVNRHNDLKVNEFLIQMERYPGILFCNTNLPDLLDDATSRRFHFKIGFNALTEQGIEILWKNYFSQYEITQNQFNTIFNSGNVTPGDFGALNGKLRFVGKDKLNSDYIVNELCKIVREKKGTRNKRIGFGA
jgi:chromosomal replication initiation ATPase DnaA